MDNLLIKTYKAHQKRIKCLNDSPRGIKRSFICLPIIFQEIVFSLAYLPHFLKNLPYCGFSSLAGRDEKGEFLVSYSRYLTYKKYALSFLTICLTLVGLATSLFVFTIEPKSTLAASGCTAPYTVDINAPTSNQTICLDDTLTFSGHWHDGGAVCTYQQSYKGQVCESEFCIYETINFITALSSESGSFTGVVGESLAGLHTATFSDTLLPNMVGEYNIRLAVQNGATSVWYYSPTRTITVEDAPAISSQTIAANSHNETSITWGWTNVAQEDEYRVYDGGGVDKSGELAADTTSWQENSLSANTQYTRRVRATNDNCGYTQSNTRSVYTSIQAATGVSIDAVTNNSITLSGSGSISNLASGSSGIYFAESVSGTNSGWLQANSWEKTGLSPNTQYSFTAQTRNGDGDTTTATAAQTQYTLAADPDTSTVIAEGGWTNATNFTFTNDAGFGAGGVEYYRYVWDKNSTYSFNNTETQWSAGTKALTATSEGDWYLHIKSYNAEDTAGAALDLGPYRVDITSPEVVNSQTGDDTWRNSAGTTYPVSFLSNGGAPLDYAQYAIGTSQGGSDILGWTNIYTNDAASYTTPWSLNFSSLQEGMNYVSFRVFDTAGNYKEVLNDGFYVLKDTIPAAVSNFSINTTTSTAVVTWMTDEATKTQVAWGLTDSLGNLTVEDANLTTAHSATLTGLSSGQTYYVKPVSKDRAANESVYASQSFATNTLTPTVITNVQTNSINATSVNVTWTTNHAADSKVRYGLTTAYGLEVYDSALVTNHSIILTGLTAGTTYHYEVLSTGNTTTFDADSTFATQAETLAQEEEAEEEVYLASPTLVYPTENIMISSARPTITGLARSNNTIFIFIDSDLEGTVLSTNHASGTGSFAYQLKNNLADGSHTVYTIARNAAGVYSERSPKISFSVARPEYVTPTLLEPIFTDGENPTVIIRGVAYNDSLIKVYMDGEYIGEFTVTNSATNNTASFHYTIPLSELSEGSHSITTQAFNDAGKSSNTSNAVSFVQEKITAKPAQTSYQFSGSVKYSVVAGDSLWKLAERFYGDGSDYTKIIEANQSVYPTLSSNPSIIQIGWQLIIP